MTTTIILYFNKSVEEMLSFKKMLKNVLRFECHKDLKSVIVNDHTLPTFMPV